MENFRGEGFFAQTEEFVVLCKIDTFNPGKLPWYKNYPVDSFPFLLFYPFL